MENQEWWVSNNCQKETNTSMEKVINECINTKNHNDVKEETNLRHCKEKFSTRGLGDLISTANHITITVSDVDKSLLFYTEVMGFHQIRRPNFDRNGAWLTLGNIELHLIFGKPVVPLGDDLIVSHISVETDNIEEVLRRLKEIEIPLKSDVSVFKDNESEKVITQFFLCDPDGYYLEILEKVALKV